MVQTEQTILRYSIIATLIVAAVAVIVGLLAHSFSIVFDGVYMLVDAAMSGLALLVARLIATTSASDAPRGTLLEERPKDTSADTTTFGEGWVSFLDVHHWETGARNYATVAIREWFGSGAGVTVPTIVPARLPRGTGGSGEPLSAIVTFAPATPIHIAAR